MKKIYIKVDKLTIKKVDYCCEWVCDMLFRSANGGYDTEPRSKIEQCIISHLVKRGMVERRSDKKLYFVSNRYWRA